MPRTSSEEVAGILLDDPERGGNQGFREAKEVRWRGVAQQSWAVKRQAPRLKMEKVELRAFEQGRKPRRKHQDLADLLPKTP